MSLRESPAPHPVHTATLPAVDAMFALSAVAAGPDAGARASGKLAGEAAATRLAALLQQQRTAGRRFVRLDLSELSILDRASFDVLVDAHQQFLDVGGALILTGVGPWIARLLQLTGLDRTLFTIARVGNPPPAGAADPAMVDRAVGVVMGRAHCGITEATGHLATLARATNRTLDQVARSILDEHSTPGATRRRRRDRSNAGGSVTAFVCAPSGKSPSELVHVTARLAHED